MHAVLVSSRPRIIADDSDHLARIRGPGLCRLPALCLIVTDGRGRISCVLKYSELARIREPSH